MKVDLKGKNILVTGGGGFGVGSGMCDAIVEAGGNLIVNDLFLDTAQKAADRYENAIAIEADVSNEESVIQMFEDLRSTCGVIHGLINNAGIGLVKPSHKVSSSEFNQLYSIDVQAVWMVSKAFVNQLLPSGETGNIVNVSSVNAHATTMGYAIYASAKSAVEGLTKGMSLDLGKFNIRVNCVAPGYVHSEQGFELIGSFTPNPQAWVEDLRDHYQSLEYFVDAIDCGRTAAFLLSDLSRSITGQTIVVDAGLTSMLFSKDFMNLEDE